MICWIYFQTPLILEIHRRHEHWQMLYNNELLRNDVKENRFFVKFGEILILLLEKQIPDIQVNKLCFFCFYKLCLLSLSNYHSVTYDDKITNLHALPKP
jgi:hypothetical protein